MEDSGTVDGKARESVWSYPRPPRIEHTAKRIRVVFAGEVIADTTRAIRYLETSHPPSYYIPVEDVRTDILSPSTRTSVCEYKGAARYRHVCIGGREVHDAVWYYPAPREGFEPLAGYLAFYPQKMDECSVDGEAATAQPGEFYGGWITRDIDGPFKGEKGSLGW